MEQIKGINEHIKDALDMWAGVMLKAEADHWSYFLEYSRRDVENALLIFIHVLANVGIKSGEISIEKADEIGKRLHDLVKEMTGMDTAEDYD